MPHRTAARPCGVRDFARPLDFLDALDGDEAPDIALLDICMPGISGVQLARALRARKATTRIIFLTTSKDYAIDAFEVNAVHYLVKPFTQEQFDEAMRRTIDLFTAGPKRISINGANGSTTVIDIAEISHIESIGYRRHVHTAHGKLVEMRRTLKEFATELDALSPGQFIAPYRGYIVNLAAIRTITPKCVEMKDGSRILIKSGDFRKLKDSLFAYLFRKD